MTGEQMNYDVTSISAEEQARRDIIEKKRNRVDNLKKWDNHYGDSVYDLARTEEKFRERLTSLGVEKKDVDNVSDEISDETLEKIEANSNRGADALTGLRSRSAYKEEMPQLLSMEKRTQKDCSILMIDCDHFKSVNDSHGHLVGDDVLKKISNLIKGSVRASDIVYRYGGEEFVVFLPDTASASAQELAEKIRANVEAHSMEIVRRSGEKVTLNKTVSIGVVGTDDLEEWKQYDESQGVKFLEKMIDLADMAAYASKETGRNKVTSHNGNHKKIQPD